MTKEMTKYDLQKQYIEKLIEELMLKDETLYYTPTVDICHLLFQRIQNGQLNKDQRELLIDLSPKDIQIFLSYSSCC